MKEIVAKVLKKALKEKEIDLGEKEILELIETPPSPEMGDYAFPTFSLAKILKESPNRIALDLRREIKIPKEFEDVQTSGPYLNFFVNRKNLAINLIKEILLQKDNFGKLDLGNNEKVLIEHTSINPNASPHVGRARNAIIGDSIVRILKFVNFNPEVHYYVNDVSKQIAMLVLAKAEKLKFESMLKKYISISKKVKNSKKMENKVFYLLSQFEDNNKEVTKKFNQITKTCVKGQAKILAELGIKYDFFDYESSYLENSKNVLLALEKTGKLFKDENNRVILNQEGTVVEKMMKAPMLVLTRNDGTGLYPLRDLAYTLEKIKKAKKNILVLGEDQKLYFLQIREALKSLNKPAPEVIHYSFILLSEKGESKKMSTRKGDVVLLEDFLEQAISKAKKEIKKRKTKGDPKKVGIGAVKYSILKNNNNKIIHFNLDEALSFEGDTGPYLLYSYARANSIIKKSKLKVKTNFKLNELDQKEIELIKKLSEFQKVVLSAYNNLNPTIIANYSYKISHIFNEFYHTCPVIGSDKQDFRIALVEAFKQVSKNSLALLGIDVLEEM